MKSDTKVILVGIFLIFLNGFFNGDSIANAATQTESHAQEVE